MASAATLRRGLLARVRTVRIYELAAWVAIVVAVIEIGGGSGSGVGVAVAFGVVGLAVRAGIATEVVRCDAAGISWRSTFITFRLRWDEITSVDITARPMRVWMLRGRTYFTVPCITVERGPDQPALFVTPSVWVPVVRQAEFVAAARLICPTDWSAADEAA